MTDTTTETRALIARVRDDIAPADQPQALYDLARTADGEPRVDAGMLRREADEDEAIEDDPATERPTEEAARAAIESFLRDAVCDPPPPYSLWEDGDDGWAFWVERSDTTSYVHADLSIEWYGTSFGEDEDEEGSEG